MLRCDIVPHAGMPDYAQLKEEFGILGLGFDKDGTLGPHREEKPDPRVMANLKAQRVGELFENKLAIISNSGRPDIVRGFANHFEDALQTKVTVRTLDQGFRRKPFPDMGQSVIEEFGIESHQFATFGDRWWCDVIFGRALGAGAVILCSPKIGNGDAKGVKTFRHIENQIIAVERVVGLARFARAKAIASV